MADHLNGKPVGGKKRAKAHDVLWNIKYLNKFKWVHLTERLAYEKAVHHQRMRAEVGQAKREAEHFKTGVEKSKRNKRRHSKDGDAPGVANKKAKSSAGAAAGPGGGNNKKKPSPPRASKRNSKRLLAGVFGGE